MKKYCLLLTVGMYLYVQTANAQTTASEFKMPTIIHASPNTESIMKFGNLPTNNYTGTANISIPLGEAMDGDISVPVSINYNTSGIRITEESGRVGLGWNINAGGVITRSIRGFDDFSHRFGDAYRWHNTTGNGPEITNGSKDYDIMMLNALDHGPDCESILYPGLNLTGVFSSATPYDLEPDAYQFNFNGYSGKFIMKRNREVILESKQKVKITCADDQGSSFTIKTPDGFTYEFNQIETNQDNEFPAIYRKIAWYLTKITSVKGDFVNFVYHNEGRNIQQAGSCLTQVRTEILSIPSELGCPVPTFNASYIPSSLINSPVLDKIIFRNGEIRFIYDNARLDIPGDLKLIRLEKWRDDNITLLQKWNFEYDYFNGDVGEGYTVSSVDATHPYKRLKLIRVNQIGTDGSTIPPYEFTYRENVNGVAPAKTSFARDHWGFFNGKYSTTLIPEYTTTSIDPIGIMDDKRAVEPIYSSIFSMTAIKYPTGGRTELQYESNDFDIVSSGASGYNDQNTTPPTLPNFSKYPLTGYDGFQSGYQPALGSYGDKLVDLNDMYVDNHPVTGNGTAPIKLTVFGMLRNAPVACPIAGYSTGVPDITFTLLDINHNIIVGPIDMLANACSPAPGSPSQIAIITYTSTYNLFPGKYYVRFYLNPGNSNTVNLLSYMTTTYTYRVDKRKVVDAAGIVGRDFAGGLRIAKITDYDRENKLTNVKSFDYTQIDIFGAKRSSGKRMLPPFYSYMKLVQDYNGFCTTRYLYRTSDSYTPLSSPSGAPACYDKVTVTLGSNGEFGKQEFNYYNNADKLVVPKEQGTANYSGAIRTSSPAYHTPLYAIWHSPVNGMPAKQVDYEAIWDAPNQKYNYSIVKEETNTYTNHQFNEPTAWFGIQQIPVEQQQPSNCIMYRRVNYPAIIQDRVIPVSKSTKIIDKSDPAKSLTSITTYQYDANTHLQLLKQETNDSKGNLLKTEYKYPNDFTGFVYSDMVNKDIVNPVIEQKKYNNTALISQLKTNYGFWNTPLMPLPYFIQTAKSTNLPETEITYNSYDNKGNPLQYTGKDGVPVSYVWGYKQSYPVAKITGQEYAYIVTVLGQNDQNLAYLQNLDGATLVTELNKIRNILKVNNPLAQVFTYTYKPLVGMLTQTDPNGKTMTYEYDAFNRLSFIRDQDNNIVKKICYNYFGQTEACSGIYKNAVKSGIFTRNNCTPSWYVGTTVTYTVPAGTYSAASQAAADLLAQNDVDANGQAYANDPAHSTCTAPFYNETKTGSFTRTNCGAGFTGGTVTYTVPAFTYGATSQFEANQLALNDVSANGQAYANNPANGATCTPIPSVTVVGYNTKASLYQVKFTNTATGTNYTFNLTPNTFSTFTLGNVPAGNYTVQFYAWLAASVNATFYVNGFTQVGTTATFSNITVNSSTESKMY